MAHHKCSLRNAGVLGQHNEVSLIFAIVIINDNDHLSPTKTLEAIGKVNFHQQPLS
jgi:hypothetical protein